MQRAFPLLVQKRGPQTVGQLPQNTPSFLLLGISCPSSLPLIYTLPFCLSHRIVSQILSINFGSPPFSSLKQELAGMLRAACAALTPGSRKWYLSAQPSSAHRHELSWPISGLPPTAGRWPFVPKPTAWSLSLFPNRGITKTKPRAKFPSQTPFQSNTSPASLPPQHFPFVCFQPRGQAFPGFISERVSEIFNLVSNDNSGPWSGAKKH